MSDYVVVDENGNLVNPFHLYRDGDQVRWLTWMSREKYMSEVQKKIEPPMSAEDLVATIAEGRVPFNFLTGDPIPGEMKNQGQICAAPSPDTSVYNRRLADCGKEIAETVVEKNLAYGDAINKVAGIMMILFPNGVQPRQYMDLLLLVRDLDKTCRIADGNPDAFEESPWKDKAGYGICGMATKR